MVSILRTALGEAQVGEVDFIEKITLKMEGMEKRKQKTRQTQLEDKVFRNKLYRQLAFSLCARFLKQ